ncbi:VanZ family protein [Desulfonatronum thiodismutans]|uniref:VanZ family protein n=1 Tax=Desulfonatronum thiodismutans TaxID=159290 RepID=UPI0004ABDECF|nr:VanZ family protein [Desulfonatronum thiodismutans]
MTPETSIKRLFIFLLFTHACFIIYGSLVPFRFEYLPLSEAWAGLLAVLISPPRLYSNTNLLANVLIGIPGPFLFLAAFHTRKSLLRSLFLVPAALAYCALLAATAEFLQLYFPGRMTLLSDIMAQTMGGAMGIACWLIIGSYTRTMLQALLFEDSGKTTGTFLLLCYLGMILLLHALPLDLSARMGTLYRQLEDGRIILVPFSTWSSPSAIIASLPTVLAWMPVGWFLVRVKAWPLAAAMLVAALGAAFLEFVQLFVLSRTTDATNIPLGSMGGLAGGIIGKLSSGPTASPVPRGTSWRNTALGSALFLAWFGLTIRSFWSPFTFQFNRAFLTQRVNDISLIPLHAYIGKPYLLSAFNILEVLVYFIPLGVIFSTFVTRHFQGQSARAVTLLFFVISCLLAGLVETGQIFLPQRYPDITDWMLMVAGAMFGHVVSSLVWKKQMT